MSQRTGGTDRDRCVVSPSPARNSLQSSLNASRTVASKKSWLGSARSMISKHVPLWKAEELKPETIVLSDEVVKQDSPESEDATSIKQDQRISLEYTPPLRPLPDRQRTFTPKSAVSSLRQHIHTSRGGRKRGALCDTTGNEVQHPVDPGSLAALEAGVNGNFLKTHARKNSLGRSLVGSLRNLGAQSLPSRRISPTKRSSLDAEPLLPPTKDATEVPLPSSPIPIPPPPTLKLDLGPAALVSTSFGRSPITSPREELMCFTHQDAVSTTSPVPTYSTRLPGEGASDHAAVFSKARGPWQPSDLLRLPVDNFGFTLPSGPTTPTGEAVINFDLDGSDDPSEIFERSLEYKDRAKKKEDRKLKKMVSLDALAKECASMSPVRSSPALPLEVRLGDPATLETPTRHLSGTTIDTVPDDMSLLTRQVAHLQAPDAGHCDPATGQWKSGDPFAPGNAVDALAGTPSPDKSIILPLRPKITLQAVHSPQPRTLRLSNDVTISLGEITDFSNRSRSPTSICYTDGAEESTVRPASDRTDSVVTNVKGWTPINAERVGSVFSAPGAEESPAQTDSDGKQRDSSVDLDSADYGEFKTQHLFGNSTHFDEPEYDVANKTGSFSLIQNLRHSPSVKHLYERISKSHTSNPRVRAGTTQRVDVADIFWKFHSWVNDDQNPIDIDAARSPHRNVADMSIDHLSTASENPASDPSPATTTPDPPLMGSRVDFDLKRSARNLRYNALSDLSSPPECESAANDIDAIPATWQRKMSIVSSGHKAQDGGALLSDDALLPEKHVRTSNRGTSRHSNINLSSDSITAELRDAIADHHAFHDAMADLAPEETPTPTMSSSQALLDGGRNEHAVDGLSPSSSTHLWEDMKHCVFDTPLDTPLGGSTTASPNSKHHRESQEYASGEESEAVGKVLEPKRPTEDTLDECLEMFQHYNKYQILGSDSAIPSEQSGTPLSSRE